MEPLFPHTVTIQDDVWLANPFYLTHKHHPVTWCDSHVPQETWSFHLEMDIDNPDSDESYVFSFEDQNMAIQFALLYG